MKFFKAASTATLDILEAIGTSVCLILAGPFLLFRRLAYIRVWYDYARFLVPRHLFGAAMRAELDACMDNYERAAAVMNYVIRTVEENCQQKRRRHHRILIRLYSRVFQFYLRSGNIEAATLTVVRAHNALGVSSLPDFPDYDIRAAHVVKAGLAAGRLLEEGGLATLFMKPGEEPIVTPRRMPASQLNRAKSKNEKTSAEGAKIIPFRPLIRT